MSISGINSQLNGNVYINTNTPGEAESAIPDGQKNTTDKDTFVRSPMPNRLEAMLEDISDRGGDAISALKERSDTMQDVFLDNLYNKLEGAGVNLQEKITLRLGTDGKLAGAGNHPDNDKINTMLKENPELSDTFKDIASHSELIRDLGNVRQAVYARSKVQEYATADQANPDNVYQLSLKGEMSHFFFSRP